jgi:hypothetical protein
LSRIEIEHAHHGGAVNGALPVTYEHFIEYGLHRRMIAPAIREPLSSKRTYGNVATISADWPLPLPKSVGADNLHTVAAKCRSRSDG